jgi:integrase
MKEKKNQIERGITRMADGRYRARISFNRKEYERTFNTLEPARRWRRNLQNDLENLPAGIEYGRSGWKASVNNKSGYYTKTFVDKNSAINWIEDTKRSLDNGTFVSEDLARLTFEDFLVDWRESKVRASSRTMMRYEVLLRNQIVPTLGGTCLININDEVLQKWIAKLKKSGVGAASIHKAYKLVLQILQSARKIKKLVIHATESIELPKIVKKPQRSLNVSELLALAKECGPYEFLVLFQGLMGTRISEALALKVADIDFESKLVHVEKAWTFGEDYVQTMGTTKTNQTRSIPIPEALLEGLASAVSGRKPNDWLFTGAGGELPLNYGWFRKTYFVPAVKKLGLRDISIHSLRHTFASLVISTKAPVTNVSALLGHSSTQQTLETYAHLFNHELAENMNNVSDLINRSRDNKGTEAA